MSSRLKVYLPVLVVAVVVLGGYFLSGWIRDRGNDDGAGKSVAAAEKTAQREEQSPAAPGAATRTPRARTATTTPRAAETASASAARDLEVDEDRGGHTLSRHVGRTDAELRKRLVDEPDISAASTYTDQDAAELSVGTALAQGKKKVSDWENGSSHPNLVLRVTMPTNMGRSLRNGDKTVKPVKAAVVVLKWTGRDWFVLTSYPEDR